MSPDYMYYDKLKNTYVTETDPRFQNSYVKTYKKPGSAYIEAWLGTSADGMSKDIYMNIVYPPETYYSSKHDAIFKAKCEKNNFKPIELRYWLIPKDKFEEYYKRFILKIPPCKNPDYE